MSLIYTPPLSGGRRKGLYLGGQKDAKSREKLNKWGVTHILNVTTEKDSGVQVRNKEVLHYFFRCRL